MANEMILRSGESLVEFSKRFPDWKFDSGESWMAYQARIHQDSPTFRQDAGGADEGGDGLDASAEQERERMIKRRLDASGVTRAPDPAEPNAEQARKDMVKRQRDAWKTKPKKAERGPAPPTSASEKRAEEEGDLDVGEGDLEESDAVAARKAMVDRKINASKGGKR